MHINGKGYTLEHIIHLIREIDYLKTQIQPHDTGHIYTTISTLQQRVETLMSETEKEDDEFFGSYLSDSDC
jgi:hypothetical protein